jgi:hypothetical protein
MVNDPTLSHSLAEHKKTTIYDVGNPSPCFGQAEKCVKVKVVNGILISNININKFQNENYHRFVISLQANNLTSLSPYATDLTSDR